MSTSSPAGPAASVPRSRGSWDALSFVVLVGGFLIFGIISLSAIVWFYLGFLPDGEELLQGVALLGALLTSAVFLGGWLGRRGPNRLLASFVGKAGLAVLTLAGVVLGGAWYSRLHPPPVPEGPFVVGQPVDLQAPTLDEKSFNLADHRGKVVLVDFWATSCLFCVAELPNVRRVYDRFHSDGLEVVGVNLDAERGHVEHFLRRQPLPWPQVFVQPAPEDRGANPLARRYHVTAIPLLLVVDRDGNLAARNVRGGGLERAVMTALGQPIPWKDRVAVAAIGVLFWFLHGLMGPAWWVALPCGLGAMLAGALVVLALGRLLRRPALLPAAA
jgi:thiol-disulfide isomerase/thioredoxin